MIYPWQTEQWKQLLRLRNENRLPHALIFNGPEGLGKRALAQTFAHLLLCKNSAQSEESCGHCHACHLFQAGSHPDYRVIQPEEEGQAIKIDQIRELSEFVQQTAHQGGLRVVLIKTAQAMNKAAANALLKTLEEPAPQTLLILISDNRAQLPVTVLSRCQQLRFSPPSRELALNWLHSQDPSLDWEPLLGATQNAPLLAQTWQQEGVWSAYQRFMNDLQALTRQEADPYHLAVQWKDTNTIWIFNLFFQWLLKHMRRREVPFEWVEYFQSLRAEALGSYNLNQQLLLESLFIRWAHYVSR